MVLKIKVGVCFQYNRSLTPTRDNQKKAKLSNIFMGTYIIEETHMYKLRVLRAGTHYKK